MDTRVMKKLGITNSLLGLGCMRLPTLSDGSIDYEHGQRMIDYALEHGITYFDTALVYHGGESETFLGKVLCSRHKRDSYTIATKLPVGRFNTLEECKGALETALNRLQTSYIDFYLLHGISYEAFKRAKGMGVLDWMVELKAKGIIKHICFSTHDTPANVIKILDEFPFEFCQMQLNYLDWEMQDAKTLYAYLAEHEIPIIVMEPVRGGRLMTIEGPKVDALKALDPSASLAKWALRFVADLPAVSVILSGMSNMEQLKENIETFSPIAPLTKEEHEAIAAVREEILAVPVVPCTGCNYCDVCPQQIAIPDIFTRYNDYLRFGDLNGLKRAKQQIDPARWADQCIGCGACKAECPQHIDIPELMKKIAELVG